MCIRDRRKAILRRQHAVQPFFDRMQPSDILQMCIRDRAYAAGLTERPEPAAARELIPHFSWARIPRRDLFLPDLFR